MLTLSRFSNLLLKNPEQTYELKPSKKKFRTNSIHEMTFSDFVDCENYIEDGDFKNFCRIFVRKRFFEIIFVNNLPWIVEEYARQKQELFDENDFIFDPPQYGEPAPVTPGSEIRKEFVERFGNYVVLMDKVCKGDMTRYKEVEKWTVREFFFWANYLTGQAIVEKVK